MLNLPEQQQLPEKHLAFAKIEEILDEDSLMAVVSQVSTQDF